MQISAYCALGDIDPPKEISIGMTKYRKVEDESYCLQRNSNEIARTIERAGSFRGAAIGQEYEASMGIGKAWKLRGERGTEVTSLSALESRQKVHYCVVDDNKVLDADEIIEIINDYDDFETLAEAMDYKFKDQSVIKVTVDYHFEKVPEPSFESELEELKKKYGKV